MAIEKNQPELFERETAEALAVAPGFAQIYLLRAQRDLSLGHPELALDALVRARQIDADVPWSGVILAGTLNTLNRYREAAAELDRVPHQESEGWEAKYERARAETGLGNVEEALRWSELAVAVAPVGCTDARLLRANALNLAGQHLEAFGEWKMYLALDRRGKHRAEVLKAIENAELASEQRVRRNGEEEKQGNLLAMK